MASSEKKLVVFLGSTREGRLVARVWKMVSDLLEKMTDFKVTVVDPLKLDVPVLRQALHFMKDQSAAPKWMLDTHEVIKSADAFLVISSEYNCAIPPALTNVMDHFPPASYRHKPCGIICYSMGIVITSHNTSDIQWTFGRGNDLDPWIVTFTSRPVASEDAEAPSGAAKTLKFPFIQYSTDVTASAVSGHNPRLPGMRLEAADCGTFGGTRAAALLRPFLSELGTITIPAQATIPLAHQVVTETGDYAGDEKWKDMVVKVVKELDWYSDALAKHKAVKGTPS